MITMSKNKVKIHCPFLLMLCVLSGCVSTPPQVIELSDVVSEQISHIEKSHRSVVRAYYSQLEYQVNNFIDNEWVPSFLGRAVENEELQKRLEDINAGIDIDVSELKDVVSGSGKFTELESNIIFDALSAEKLKYRVRFANLMLEFSNAAMQEINKIRNEWHTKLRDSESEFMTSLDSSYGDLKTGHLTIKSYLASVAEVVSVQDRIAEKLGVLDKREELLDELMTGSERLSNGATSLNTIVESLKNIIDENESDEMPLESDVLQDILDNLN